MSQGGNLFEVAQQAIDKQTAFGELLTTAEKQYLLDHGVVRSAMPGEVLCRQHQIDTRVFILVMGEVEVKDNGDGQGAVLAKLHQGELFGEISALFKLPRVSNVEVSKSSVLLEIPGDILEKVISNRVELFNVVSESYKQRITDSALRSSSLFRYIPNAKLQSLVEQSSLIDIPAGSIIIQEGETGDAFYIMIYGTARVTHKVGDEEMNIALLRAGDYFGEWSVLTGAPRAASVSAVTRVELIRVDCRLFLEFIKENPEIRDRIDMVAHNRHTEAAVKCHLAESREAVDIYSARIEDIMRTNY